MPLLVLQMQRANLQRRLGIQYQRIVMAKQDESAWLRTSGEPLEIMTHEIFKTLKALNEINERIRNAK
jgi:hypothetical protein